MHDFSGGSDEGNGSDEGVLSSAVEAPVPDLLTGHRWLRLASLPGPILMLVCVFLPQSQDCHGRTHTPIDDAWWPLLVGVALLGALPALWRFAAIRRWSPILATGLAVLALGQIVVGLPLALFLVYSYIRMDPSGREAATAASATAFLVVFILMFPILSTLVDRTWLVGGYLTWVAAWLEALVLFAWMNLTATVAAARARPPRAIALAI